MWSRKVLKEKAKSRIKVNYWKMLLVGLILSLLGGGASSSIRSEVTSEDKALYNNYYEYEDGEGFEYYVDGDGATLHIHGDDVDEDLARDVLGMGLGIAGMAIGIFLVIFAIVIALTVFVLNPLIVGGRRFFYRNINEKAELKELGFAFDHGYMNQVKAMFLRDLFTFLWTLLFIVPGIVKSYEYRMIPYLLAENPNMSSEEAFAISKRMMDGNKWNAFVFDLSFIGWFILGGITFGIVDIFYVNLYYNQASAMLYDAIKIDDRMKYEQSYANNQ